MIWYQAGLVNGRPMFAQDELFGHMVFKVVTGKNIKARNLISINLSNF
jgi:hypothetical protein